MNNIQNSCVELNSNTFEVQFKSEVKIMLVDFFYIKGSVHCDLNWVYNVKVLKYMEKEDKQQLKYFPVNSYVLSLKETTAGQTTPTAMRMLR